MSALPILDPKPLQDLLDLGAEVELIQELIALLQEDAPLHMAALRRALDASDAEGVLQEAHQLKGSLGNLGLARFAELAARIESHARTGCLEPVRLLAEILPAAYEEALGALRIAYPRD